TYDFEVPFDSSPGSMSVSWSPTSEWIAVREDLYHSGPVTSERFGTVDATTGESHPLGGVGDWSPDSTQMAYARAGELHIVDVPSGNDRVLATPVSASSPAWSPDGSTLAFAGSEQGSDSAVYVEKVDGTGFR